MRQAAAAGRQALLKLAATRLDAPVDKLDVTDGVVSVANNPETKVSYAELVGGKRFDVKIVATGTGWDLKVAPDVRPKDIDKYKIVGTSVPRMDLPPKFTGQFTYSADVRVPGMLHGRVVRPPTVNTRPTNVDESSIKGIDGIVKVVRQGSFVGVVAQTEWAAVQASRKLKVAWSAPLNKYTSTKDEVFEYLKSTKSLRDQTIVNRGDPDTAISQAAPGKMFDATYHWPFQLHGMLGTACWGHRVLWRMFGKTMPRSGRPRRARSARVRGLPRCSEFPRKTSALFTPKGRAVMADCKMTIAPRMLRSCPRRWANPCVCNGLGQMSTGGKRRDLPN
jgi:CO/xanthine dehydrogenase Mo-binding subunit